MNVLKTEKKLWVIEARLDQLIEGLAGLRSDLKDMAEDIKTTIELKD